MKNETIRIIKADSDDLREKLFSIRREVFVVEQEVDTEEEFDEFEGISKHFVALDQNGQPVGSARWRQTEKGIKLERFAVKKSVRGKGVGASLVQTVLDDITKQVGSGHLLYLHAQLPAVPLYKKFGFHISGDQFSECNILHYPMERLS